jgi:hypothetical protein
MKRQFLALGLLASTTFGALSGFSPAQAATVSEREMNNTDLTAQVLPGITSYLITFPKHVVRGSIFSTDEDFYRVDISTSGHRLTLSITSGFFADLYFDANGNGRAEMSEKVDSIKGSSPARTWEGMDEGTFFIRAFGSPGSFSLSHYELTLQVTTGVRLQTEVEPNNRPEQATVVQGFLVGRRALQGFATGQGDGTGDGLDHYRFKVGTARFVNVGLVNIGSGGFFNLYHDKNRNGRLESGEFLQHRGESGGDAIQPQFLQAGEYILKVVKPFGSDSANYTLFLTAA